jgi:VWFA-related protein
VALFYDDLGMGFRSSVDARNALHRVVAGLDPTDRVAVVTPATWDGELRLSSDRGELSRDVSELRFQLSSRRRVYVPRTDERGSVPAEGGFLEDGEEGEWNRRLRISALVALKQLIKELGEVEGRKAVVVFSEGFVGLGQLSNRYFGRVDLALDAAYGGAGGVQEALYRLGDFAARSSVVIYAIDPRGLVSFGPSADSGSRAPPPDSHLFDAIAFRGSQSILEYLPSLTGGLAIVGTNDLVGAAEEVLDDLSGYYLVGFQPSAETFQGERPRFSDIAVAVRRKGVRIRTRRGFFGIADEDLAEP